MSKPENPKSFGLEFTDQHQYDLDEIQETTDRENSSFPLLSHVVEDQTSINSETDGQLITEKDQPKIKITTADIRKYFK